MSRLILALVLLVALAGCATAAETRVPPQHGYPPAGQALHGLAGRYDIADLGLDRTYGYKLKPLSAVAA